MRNDVNPAVMATWAAKDLPARLDVAETAKLLGFAEHDVPILMASGKLRPLSDPAPNAPKWFAAMEIIGLAADNDWLHKATREVSKYWRQKRERRQNSGMRCRSARRGTEAEPAGKASPNSSPKSSPGERWEGTERALTGDGRMVAESA